MSVWVDRLEGESTSNGALCTTFWRYEKKNVHLGPLFLEPVVDGSFVNRIKRCEVCGVWCEVCGVWCEVCGVWCEVCGVPKCGLSHCIVLCVD